MADILLVHGAAHGAWCWQETIPALEALGHSVKAIDLPSDGDDTTPVNDVTLDLYADSILKALDKPRVIVGHSMAGYPISLVAERAPALVQRLVYLCAYVPKKGHTLTQMRKLATRQPLAGAFVMSQDRKSFTFDPAQAKDRFYADCTDTQIAFAKTRLTPQAVTPSETVVSLSDRYAQVPRSYIRCCQDDAIPHELQVAMTENWPANQVVDMDASHSPFLSAPVALAANINRFIRG